MERKVVVFDYLFINQDSKTGEYIDCQLEYHFEGSDIHYTKPFEGEVNVFANINRMSGQKKMGFNELVKMGKIKVNQVKRSVFPKKSGVSNIQVYEQRILKKAKSTEPLSSKIFRRFRRNNKSNYLEYHEEEDKNKIADEITRYYDIIDQTLLYLSKDQYELVDTNNFGLLIKYLNTILAINCNSDRNYFALSMTDLLSNNYSGKQVFQKVERLYNGISLPLNRENKYYRMMDFLLYVMCLVSGGEKNIDNKLIGRVASMEEARLYNYLPDIYKLIVLLELRSVLRVVRVKFDNFYYSLDSFKTKYFNQDGFMKKINDEISDIILGIENNIDLNKKRRNI